MIKKSLFNSVNGFDEDHLAVAYNDVDLCLKIRSKGLKVVYVADALLYHYESKSRASDLSIHEKERYAKECHHMRMKWQDELNLRSFSHDFIDNNTESFELKGEG